MHTTGNFSAAFAASLLMVVTVGATGAAPGNAFSVKMTVDTYMEPVTFTLDGKTTCKVQIKKGDFEASCYIAQDCTRFAGKQCVEATIAPGKHLMKADFGDFSISDKVFVGLASAAGKKPINDAECDAGESMGNAKLYLDCGGS